MPSIPAHLIEVTGGPPTEQAVRERRVRPVLRNITRATSRKMARHRDLVDLFKMFYQLTHAGAVTVAKIDRETATGKA